MPRAAEGTPQERVTGWGRRGREPGPRQRGDPGPLLQGSPWVAVNSVRSWFEEGGSVRATGRPSPHRAAEFEFRLRSFLSRPTKPSLSRIPGSCLSPWGRRRGAVLFGSARGLLRRQRAEAAGRKPPADEGRLSGCHGRDPPPPPVSSRWRPPLPLPSDLCSGERYRPHVL